MAHLKESIESYILAKDGNRPHLMTRAFAQDASLTMTVQTAAISFPGEVKGREAIATVLVSGFAMQYENVYTFCVSALPSDDQNEFACDWLVCMTEKSTGAARVGYGRYDWVVDPQSKAVTQLRISIEEMATLPKATRDGLLNWAGKLPYPWCPREALAKNVPDIDAVARVLARLG
jgi:hypothetical protein